MGKLWRKRRTSLADLRRWVFVTHFSKNPSFFFFFFWHSTLNLLLNITRFHGIIVRSSQSHGWLFVWCQSPVVEPSGNEYSSWACMRDSSVSASLMASGRGVKTDHNFWFGDREQKCSGPELQWLIESKAVRKYYCIVRKTDSSDFLLQT